MFFARMRGRRAAKSQASDRHWRRLHDLPVWLQLEKGGRPVRAPAVKVVSVTGRCLWRPLLPVASFSPFQL